MARVRRRAGPTQQVAVIGKGVRLEARESGRHSNRISASANHQSAWYVNGQTTAIPVATGLVTYTVYWGPLPLLVPYFLQKNQSFQQEILPDISHWCPRSGRPQIHLILAFSVAHSPFSDSANPSTALLDMMYGFTLLLVQLCTHDPFRMRGSPNKIISSFSRHHLGSLLIMCVSLRTHCAPAVFPRG